MGIIPNVRDLLEGHIGLELESIDRLYLNGYVPQLQHGAGLVGFLSQQRGQPIASPALLGQITASFVAEVKAFAKEQAIPLFHFERHESKDRRAHQLRRERPLRDGVVFIGIAQEKAYAFTAHRLPSKRATFEFTRNKSVLPNYYYFYLDDADWGECVIKVCSYAPWGLKVYLNGHEWLKRQLTREGISFESLDNGFLSCQNPERLQALADALGSQQIQSFLQKWLDRLPMPLSTQDRGAGYDYRLSIWQMEFSLTQIVDRPLSGRQFFCEHRAKYSRLQPRVEPCQSPAEEAVKLSLEQEEQVTTQINALVSMAKADSDYTADNFLHWFIKEQLEEVASMGQLLRVVQRAGEGQSAARGGISGTRKGQQGRSQRGRMIGRIRGLL